MQTLPPQQFEQFVNLLRNTYSPDNGIRKSAEEQLKAIDRDNKINALLLTIINEKDLKVCEMACLILRQELIHTQNLLSLTTTTLTNLKTSLPQLCLQQESKKIRDGISDIISTLLATFSKIPDSEWIEGIQFFYDCFVSSTHLIAKEIGLRILDQYPKLLKKANDEKIRLVFQVIQDILSFDPNNSEKLIVSAMGTFISVITSVPSKKIKKLGQPIVQVFVQLVKTCRNEEILQELLGNISFVYDYKSSCFKSMTVPIIESVLSLLSYQTLSDPIRKICLESITTISEKASNFREACANLLPIIVETFIRHICLIQEDPDWSFSVNPDSDQEDMELSTIAETCLDRLTCAVKGKVIYPIIMEKISLLITSNIWQHRAAALITISCVAEGSLKVMKPHLPRIVEVVVPYLRDEHPRVVYSAINVVGQLAIDFQRFFFTSFHQMVYPAIFYSALNYSQCPRVQAHAICCFVNLIDTCPETILSQYTDQMATILHQVFVQSVNDINKPGQTIVLENVLNSYSTLADTIDKNFSKYYSSIVPSLITLARSFSASLHTKFYVATLQTLSDIFIACGRETCLHDMDSVLEILKSYEIDNIKVENDRDYKMDYLRILANIAEVFGDSMQSILPKLIPFLNEIISSKTETDLITSSVNDLMLSNEDHLKKAFSAHTELINDKSTACFIVKKLLETIQNPMLNFIDEISNTLIVCFNETHSEEIISVIGEIFPLILEISEKKGINFMLQKWLVIFDSLSRKIAINPELYDHSANIRALTDCLKKVSLNGISNEVLLKIVGIFNNLFEYILNTDIQVDSDSNSLGSEDTNSNNDSGYEYQEIEDLLHAMERLQGKLFKILKDNYYPYFIMYFESILKLSSSREALHRSWFCCFLADMVEYTPSLSYQLLSVFEPPIKTLIADCSLLVKRPVVYLISIMAEYAHEQYQIFISQFLQIIVEFITHPKSRDEENISLTCISICAISKIIKFCPSLISPLDNAIITWLSWLPVIEDDVPDILSYFLDLIETKFALVAGPNNSNLFKNLDSFAVMIPHCDDDDVTKRCINILSQLRVHMPDVFELWFSNLNAILKEDIQLIQSQYQN